MVDQYLRNMNSDLAKVKAETAAVMAEEQRAKREYHECQADMEKMESYAMKALQAGNEGDARKFLEALFIQQHLHFQRRNSIINQA